MNYLHLSAAILALFATIGHFTMGYKMYMLPVKNSNIDTIPKNIMVGLFHYASVFMIISTIVLFYASIGSDSKLFDLNIAVLLIGTIYAGWAIVQLIIAITSSVKGALFKMFQWIFWLVIALLVFMSEL